MLLRSHLIGLRLGMEFVDAALFCRCDTDRGRGEWSVSSALYWKYNALDTGAYICVCAVNGLCQVHCVMSIEVQAVSPGVGLKLAAMEQSTKKRTSSATKLQEEQRDGAMKVVRALERTCLVSAHQRQLPRSRLNDNHHSEVCADLHRDDLPGIKRTYIQACADLHPIDLHGSHKIMLYRGIWFCASCGAYTDGRRKHSVRNLRSQCKPGTRAGKMRLRRLALGRHPDLKPWPAELNRHRIESASPWPAPLQRIRLTRKTRPELDEIARELVLAGRACPRGVRPASSNAAASSSRQVAVAAYGAAAVAAYKCGAVAAYSEVQRLRLSDSDPETLNDAAASNSEVPRLRFSDSDPETQQLIEAAPKLRRSCADANGCGRCSCETCYPF